MHDLDLFQQALGLVEPWEVVDVKFDAERRRLDLRVDFRKGARFPCPSVPLTARQALICHPANHPGRGIINTHGRPRDLPVLAHGARRTCLGSSTAQGPPATRENAASGAAFHLVEGVGTPNYWYFAAQ